MGKDIPENVYLKTFGGFDLYKDGQMVYFSCAKAKELLAYLVDRGGRYVTLEQLAETLFENEGDQHKAKKMTHTAYSRLQKTLKDNELEYLLKKGRGLYAINRCRVLCDSYEMQAHRAGAANQFLGEYMPEYSWAEVTLSNLIWEYCSQNRLPVQESWLSGMGREDGGGGYIIQLRLKRKRRGRLRKKLQTVHKIPCRLLRGIFE